MNPCHLLIAGLLVLTTPLPSVAHKVEIQNDVGATLHIEPDDIPKAGAPSDLWFALTQAGGTVIPLESCDCSFTVYDGSGTAIAMPSLEPVSAEGYADIPGASVTFPEVGAYELVLTGAPADGEQFTPFELRFDVTVAARAAASPSPEATATAAENPSVTEPADTTAPAGTDPSADTDSSTDTDISVAVETPSQATSSFPWRTIALLSGAVLAVGVFGVVIGGSRSTGGKS